MPGLLSRLAAMLFLCAGFAGSAYAAAPELQMVPEKTIVRFIAKQSGSAVEGKFTEVSGKIFFDPAQLESSSAHIEIKPASVASADSAAAQELPGAAWFNVAQYPQAVFDCKQFVKLQEKEFEAHGTLTIRGHSEPVVLPFTLIRYDEKGAEIEGKTTLSRTAFGLGQGEWKETNVVADEVVVTVHVEAKRLAKE